MYGALKVHIIQIMIIILSMYVPMVTEVLRQSYLTREVLLQDKNMIFLFYARFNLILDFILKIM